MRESVTLTRKLYQLIKEVRPLSIRSDVLFLTLDSLFEGHLPETSKCSDEIHNAVVGLHYELTQIQKQFDNGKVQKKLREQNKGSFCLVEPSQSERKQATAEPISLARAYDMNNINNNIINTNKQTIQTSNQEQENVTKKKDVCQFELTQRNREETQWWLEILEEHSKKLGSDLVTQTRFLELIHSIAEEHEPLKVQGYYRSPDAVLEKYVDFFRCDDNLFIVQKISEIFEEADVKAKRQEIKINNKYRYIVSMMYAKAKGL